MWKKKKKPITEAVEVVKPPEPEERRRKRVPNFYPSDVCNAVHVYMDAASHAASRERYETAIRLYTTAAKVAKMDTEKGYMRVMRSACHLALCDVSKARRDVAKAKKLCPDLMQLNFQRANVLYNQNLFENALITYEYGSRQRTFPDLFGNGVNVATGTLENCVGRNAGAMLSPDDLGKIIIEQKLQDIGKKTKKTRVLNDLQKKRQDVIMEDKKKHLGEKYLGMIAREKMHMIEMLMSPALFGSNNKHNKVMEDMLIRSIEKLEILQDCLWRRKPLYAFEHKRGKPAEKFVRETKEEAILKNKLLVNDLKRQMHQIIDLYEKKDWNGVYRLCEYLRGRLWRIADLKGFNKEECLNFLVDIVGDMYFNMKTLEDDWPSDWNDMRALAVFGLTPAYASAKEVTKSLFHYPVFNAQQKIKKLTESANLTHSQYQKMYFNFEIACLYSMVHNLPQMRSFTRQALFTARKINNVIWYLNCLFLLARTDIQENNIDGGMVTLLAIRETCVRYGYAAQGVFAARALILLAKLEPKQKSIGPRGSAHREKNIINLMPNQDLKSRARALIWQMNQKPPWKRMPLVKGVQVAFQGAKKGGEDDELVREEAKRKAQKVARKKRKAEEAVTAAAESIKSDEGLNFLSINKQVLTKLADQYRRRSTYNLEMFQFK